MVTEWSRRYPNSLHFGFKPWLYGHSFIELGSCLSFMLWDQVSIDVEGRCDARVSQPALDCQGIHVILMGSRL